MAIEIVPVQKQDPVSYGITYLFNGEELYFTVPATSVPNACHEAKKRLCNLKGKWEILSAIKGGVNNA
jgi:hypothetical protein